MPSVGSFILILNEAQWIAPHLLSWLPILDEMRFHDGGSTDGTIEIIEAIRRDSPHGHKIRLVHGKNPTDLRDDYTRLFDEALRSLGTDLAFFLHPDMVLSRTTGARANLENLEGAIAASTHMRSFAGEPGGPLLEISGRAKAWKNIYRLRNPDIGAHYFGWYGAWNEDVYFRDITGDDHTLHYRKDQYPYEVPDSGLEILHFSDVRPYARRLARMKTCFANQGKLDDFDGLAEQHPRVTLKDGGHIKFTPAEYPAEFLADRAKFQHLERNITLVHA